jgi:DNA-binding transcriptional regulator GbsR (MarR family)
MGPINLKQKKTNKTKIKQNLNEQIEESNRLRHMQHEEQQQLQPIFRTTNTSKHLYVLVTLVSQSRQDGRVVKALAC